MRLAWLVVLVGLTSTAHADRKTAERYFHAGEKAYKAQNFDAAAQNFDRAYEAFDAPELAFSAAQAHRKQFRVETNQALAVEHAKKAVALYRVYLAKVTKGGRVGDAIDNLAEMLRELDRLGIKEGGANAVVAMPAPAPRKTMLGVTVVFADQTTSSAMREIDEQETETQRVTTTIDGKPVPPDELVAVEPGEHVVRAEAEGYVAAERKTKVIKDQEDFENLELQPKPARVTITTEAGARISVDGRPAGTAPAAAIEMTAGTHVVTISRRGREPVAREVSVTRGEAKTLTIGLDKSVRRRVVPWVLGTAGGLAVLTIAGVVPWMLYENRAEDLDAKLEQGNQPKSVADDYNNAVEKRDTVRNGMWITGGAALAVASVGFALYYFDTPSTEAVRVTPVITPGAAAAVISGRF
jgi:hypothetical protein